MSIQSKHKRRQSNRRGWALLEIVVAAVLLLCMLSMIAPVAHRLGRIWKSGRDYSLMAHSVANQLEQLVPLSVSECQKALADLKPPQELLEVIPTAELRGELLQDEHGARVVLAMIDTATPEFAPIRLVAWLETADDRSQGEKP